MEITFVKSEGPGFPDRVYMEMGGEVGRAPVHVLHDLPHLAVESALHVDDGLWAELAAGRHAAAARAATARHPKQQKAGRIVSGAAAGKTVAEWLTPGHRTAKVLTNAVTNQFGDGAGTPAGVRDRVARSGDTRAQELLSSVDDAAIAVAVAAVGTLMRRWGDVPPGGALRLSWPLPLPVGDVAAGEDR